MDDLDPMFAASVIMGIHSQNQSQAAQILFSIADADELRLEGHLARLTETDPIHAGEILVSLINENVTEVASLMEDVIEGDNGQILQAMFVEAAMNDDLAIAQLVNEAALTPGCLLYTSPSPRDRQKSRMPYSA